MLYICTNKSSAIAEMGDRLATIDIGRKVCGEWLLCRFFGGSRVLSNTMWPGPRPTSVPSFVLIHLAFSPQYTNVTDRQDRQDRQPDRQRSDSIGRIVLQTVAQKSHVKRLVIGE